LTSHNNPELTARHLVLGSQRAGGQQRPAAQRVRRVVDDDGPVLDPQDLDAVPHRRRHAELTQLRRTGHVHGSRLPNIPRRRRARRRFPAHLLPPGSGAQGDVGLHVALLVQVDHLRAGALLPSGGGQVVHQVEGRGLVHGVGGGPVDADLEGLLRRGRNPRARRKIRC